MNNDEITRATDLARERFEAINRLNTIKFKQPKTTKVTQPRPVQVKAINVKGITGGSVTATSGAGGKALTKAESDALEGYIALLLQRLRAAHSTPAGLSDPLQAKVRFSIAANGTISNVKIITSSGSWEFDQSVLEAFAKLRSIGAVPNGKGDAWEVVFWIVNAERASSNVLNELSKSEREDQGLSISPGARRKAHTIPTNLVGPTAVNARWSNYGQYLQQLIESVQIQWERILTQSRVDPSSGTRVSVKFILNDQGVVTQFISVEGSTSELIKQSCVSAIAARSPYGEWTEDMKQVLGTQQEMTFTFYSN